MRFWITVTLGAIIVSAISTALYVWNPDMTRRRNEPTVAIAAPPVDPDNCPKAVALVTQEKHSNVPQLHVGESIFKIVNEGTGILDLKPGQKSCTCVGVSFKKEPMGPGDSEARVQLAPGETVEFVVRWDTQDRVGPFKVDAPVLTNDPFNKQIPFQVELNVVPDLMQYPEYLNFGTLGDNQEVTRDILIYSTTTDSIEITDPRFSSNSFRVAFTPLSPEELKSLEAKAGVKGSVTVRGPLPVGEFIDTMTLATNLKRMPNTFVRMTGRVEGKFQLSPSRIDFGTILPKSGGDKKAQIFAKGLEEDRKLVVGEVTPSFLEVKLEKDPELKVLWRLAVHVPESAPKGPFQGRIVIEDTAGEKRLNVAVQGTVSGAIATTAGSTR